MRKIAVVGTGIMGAGIASNFLKRGYQVFVWNRHQSRLEGLVKKGAEVVGNPKEAAEKADIIFEVTANDESSRQVWLGKEGILAGSSTKKYFITCATLSSDWIDKLSKICKAKKLKFLDMPMTGGRQGAETGQLILLTGGSRVDLKKIERDLKAISSKIIYFGKAGSGMRFKLLLNTLQAIHLVALGEVLRLGKLAGLNIKTVGEALAERPGGTATKLAWRDFQKNPKPINFSVKWITKDLGYAKELSRGLPTPLLDQVLEKYQKALSKNLGDKDWSVITKFLK